MSNHTQRFLIKPASMPRLLVVDDDPTFGKIIERVGRNEGVDVTVCESVDEVDVHLSSVFDVAIIDYDLGPMTGMELTRYLEQVSGCPPVILVSRAWRDLQEGRPDSIVRFVHKALGAFAILDAAFEAHDISLIHRSMAGNQLI